jgi:hypothetical protein
LWADDIFDPKDNAGPELANLELRFFTLDKAFGLLGDAEWHQGVN